ncbi:MAG TPA: 4a-hydroxytetrahydrobiopterin dehydratase [Gemmataceae bacterium]|nr:4a-hydroxytetrahydrobiopterin dehydratase [Gemmataceae bacterium]
MHLVGYRNVAVELWTHAVNGLTGNDFILAARINELPVDVRKAARAPVLSSVGRRPHGAEPRTAVKETEPPVLTRIQLGSQSRTP